MATYNLDTSILLDSYEKRGSNGEIAIKFFDKLIKEKENIIFSDLHIKELKGIGYNTEEIRMIFKTFNPNNIKRVHIIKNQLDEMNRLSRIYKIPKRDILHVIISRDNEAIMIANDKHFEKLTNIVEVKKPEELL